MQMLNEESQKEQRTIELHHDLVTLTIHQLEHRGDWFVREQSFSLMMTQKVEIAILGCSGI